MVFFVCRQKNTTGSGPIPMGMIAQEQVNIQDTLEKVLRNIPVVLFHDTKTYILVKDLSNGLEEFIRTGKTGGGEIGVFSDKQEKELTASWCESGYEYAFHYQTLEFMNKRISVKYPVVKKQKSETSVSLIPWCMLPGRPYPVFVYAYANWHYSMTGQKSMILSTNAAGKVFGVASFNKSTLCRLRKDKSISGMLTGYTETAAEQTAPYNGDISVYVSELLEHSAQIKKIYMQSGDPDAQPKSGAEFTIDALSSVPDKLSKVIIDSPPARYIIHDKRKRPPRSRNNGQTKRVQRQIVYVDPVQMGYIRNEFLALCKAAVMDAAVKYHRFLI